jgi:serine-type D-Ala-D-Ala carboxypeptidase (penicillin-binding protein 5/6)
VTHRRSLLPALGCLLALALAPLSAVGALAAADVEPPMAALAAADVEPPVDALVWRSLPASFPPPPPATAPAFLLLDAQTGQVLAARAADEVRPVASTIKLLTVLTALQVLGLDDQVVVGPEARPGEGGSSASVDPGETWRVADLLDAALVRSGNDAARALAGAAVRAGLGGGATAGNELDVFAEAMTAAARDLGITDALILEPTGLDDGNQLSAVALGIISRAALADPRIRASAGQETAVNPDLGEQPTRNLLIGSYSGATGLKTGYTAAAGWSLVASAERDGLELIAVVLGSRRDQDRFDEAAALLDHGFAMAVEPLPALRARSSGAWHLLLDDAHVWAPAAVPMEVSLTGVPSSLRLDAVSGTDLVGQRTVAAPRPQPTSAGQAIVDAMYRVMQQAHLVDAWPPTG